MTKQNIIKNSSMLFISTIIVNAGNYAINLLLGRWLGPTDFSEVSLLATFLLMLSFIALAFQLTAAKYTTSLQNKNEQANLILWLKKKAYLIGTVLMFSLIISAYFLHFFFQTSHYVPFLIFAVGLPFYLLMSINRGILQGQHQYKQLALSYQYEMWAKLLVSLALIYLGFKVNGVAIGLSVSLIFTWWITRIRDEHHPETKFIQKKEILSSFLAILIYECSQILINNSDIILVKHFFKPKDAGTYAALALIGRMVYFGTWTVVTMLFPIVIQLEKEGKKHHKHFLGALVIVISLSSFIVLICYFYPSFLIHLLFGNAYIAIAPMLGKYALATALFSFSNVFVYYYLSLNKHIPVYMTITAGFTQIIFIVFFHQNFQEIINIQIIIMAFLFLSMIAFHIFNSFEKKL